MDAVKCKPYTLDTALTGYLPVPRELLTLGLPSRAILLYGVLLDRATLSQKNHYADETGWIYVIYPVEHLAETLSVSDTAVKRHLRELETQGLIRRCREGKRSANHIYVNLPSGSIKGTSCTEQRSKLTALTERKVPPNNRKQQQDKSNYYQHGEDESL